MEKTIKPFLFALTLFFIESSYAQTGSAASLVIQTITAQMDSVMSQLTQLALKWLAVLAVLQFLISNYKIILGENDLSAVFFKLTSTIIWLAVCVYIIENGPNFIADVGKQFFGVVGEMPSASGILLDTLKISSFIAAGGIAISAVPMIGDNIGHYVMILSLIVGIAGVYFAAKIFMLQLELGMIVLLSPISFAFLGLNSLRDQGLAPFKSLLALGYRIILVLIIVVAFDTIGDGINDEVAKITTSSIVENGVQGTLIKIVEYVGGYGILMFLLFKSDSIASSLASGTVSSGASDMSAAVAAGAAAGALASGGASALAGAAKPKSMSDFMSSMASGGSSLSNASGMGAGGAAPAPFSAPASMSKATASPAASSSSGFGGSGSGTSKYADMPVPSQPVAASDLASPRFGAEPGQANSSSPSGAPSQESKQPPFDPKTARPATAGDATAAAKPSYSSSSSGQSEKPSTSIPAAQSPFPAYTGPQEAKPADFDPKTARPADFGSASTASIGGAPQQGGGDIDKRLDSIQTQLEKRGQAGLGQQFNELDRRLGQDHATTSVSINSHHVD